MLAVVVSRLNHRLQEKLLLRADLAHPTFFPNIVRRMKLPGVVKINPRDVFDRIGCDVRIGVASLLDRSCLVDFHVRG